MVTEYQNCNSFLLSDYKSVIWSQGWRFSEDKLTPDLNTLFFNKVLLMVAGEIKSGIAFAVLNGRCGVSLSAPGK